MWRPQLASFKRTIISCLLAIIFAPVVHPQSTKEQIIRLQSDILALQQQIRLLERDLDERNRLVQSLLEQLNDRVAQSQAETQSVAKLVRNQPGQVEASMAGIVQALERFNVKLDDTNNRIAGLHQKIDEQKTRTNTLPVQDLQKLEPDQVYYAAYSDYLAGNFELAVRAFQDFLDSYPENENSDNAAFYLGDTFQKLNRFELALSAFDQVINLYPKGDKSPAAYYKKGRLLHGELKRQEEAIDTYRTLLVTFPDTPEARLAQQELAFLGVEEDSPDR